MKYLFFDIECADGNYEICEFGYVITDTSFHVLEKENILMDPEGPFRLKGRAGQEDLVLSYSEEEYRSHPPFPHHYERIRGLLCDQDVIVFGFGVGNDIAFLAKDCKSYELDFFDFPCRNIQRYLGLTNLFEKRTISLGAAYELLAIEKEPFQEHRAVDDAYATMKVLQGACRYLNKSVDELAALVPSSNMTSLQYMEDRRLRADEAYQQKMKAERIARNRKQWADLIASTPAIKQGRTLYCSAPVFASEDMFAFLLARASEGPFRACNDFFNTELYVVADEEEKKSLSAIVAGKVKSQILTFDEFSLLEE